MINLARDKNCDTIIREELSLAGIKIISKKSDGEVPYTIAGKLGNFTFYRYWYYWVVWGDVPLEVAIEMYYGSAVGRRDVRCAGHCGCPPPNDWALPKRGPLKKVVKELGITDTTYGNLSKLCDEGTIDLPRFVDNYHIDSQEGLNLFVETIKRHGLIDE